MDRSSGDRPIQDLFEKCLEALHIVVKQLKPSIDVPSALTKDRTIDDIPSAPTTDSSRHDKPGESTTDTIETEVEAEGEEAIKPGYDTTADRLLLWGAGLHQEPATLDILLDQSDRKDLVLLRVRAYVVGALVDIAATTGQFPPRVHEKWFRYADYA
jgi:hypothetical protein